MNTLPDLSTSSHDDRARLVLHGNTPEVRAHAARAIWESLTPCEQSLLRAGAYDAVPGGMTEWLHFCSLGLVHRVRVVVYLDDHDTVPLIEDGKPVTVIASKLTDLGRAVAEAGKAGA